MKRYYEKISFDQFKKDIVDDINLYNEYELPKRSTRHSAGYDIRVISDIAIAPGETVMIPTGIKVSMYDDEVMYVVIRSSMGFKNKLNLANQMGVIDSDYYNNKNNEGHVFVPIRNNGNETYTIKKGEHFAQGIFSKFLIVENEEMITSSRNGGFGSTNKGDEKYE